MSQEYEYFYEDEVYRFNKKGKLQLGMVLENAELVSSDEESDVEEEEKVTKGNIRVAWYPNGEELVVSERRVCLADRSLMPGDVVRRLIKGRDTQRGYCRNVRVMARVQLVMGDRHVIPSVDSVNLTPLEDFATDMAISLDSWVGMVNMIKCRLLLMVNRDGSTCYLPDHAAGELEDTRDAREKDCEFRRYDFYPGQCLVGSAKQFEEAEWLNCTHEVRAKLAASEVAKHAFKIRTTVQKVEVQQLGVRWLCRAFCTDVRGDAIPPKYLVIGDSLSKVRILNVFEPCTLQLGDRNYYTIQEGDTLLHHQKWDKLIANFSKNSPGLSEFLNIPNRVSAVSERCRGGPVPGTQDNVSRAPTTPSTTQATEDVRKKVAYANDACYNVSDTSTTCIETATDAITTSSSAGRADGTTVVTTAAAAASSPSALTTAASAIAAALSSLTSTALSLSSSSNNTSDSTLAGAARGDDDDDSNYVDVEGSGEDGEVDEEDTASVSSGTSNSSLGTLGSRKRQKSRGGPALMTRMLKSKKLRPSKRLVNGDGSGGGGSTTTIVRPAPKPGDRVVVETLMTTSYADVVWQDGSVECGIPSSQLYPIHHLDDQEFFPGDFVVEQKPPAVGVDPHEYGVVQRVDHAGRTSLVKWFRTYTAGAEPQPILQCEQEVSVYDLHDHPDFRYRPGSVVIRVANFDNDQTCSTGQVLDNYPSGQVCVWWVDGSSSVCFPQDLYKVGEYDSDDSELWDNRDDDDDDDDSLADGFDGEDDKSWQTDSGDEDVDEGNYSVTFLDGAGEDEVKARRDDTSVGNYDPPSPQHLKTRLVANIEKARIAMSRLEEIFTQNPGLQSTLVMRQLLDCYKECRYMDKLMSTRFFHESNFAGLVEKVREKGRASSNQKMAEQFNRLFTNSSSDGNKPGRTSPNQGNKQSVSSDRDKEDSQSGHDKSGLMQSFVVSDSVVNEVKEASCDNEIKEESSAENSFSALSMDKISTTATLVKEPLGSSEERKKENSSKEWKQNYLGEESLSATAKSFSTKCNQKSSCIGLHKRLSDSDMVGNHHNTLESKAKRPSSASSHIKDSKSCNDIKNISPCSKTASNKICEADVVATPPASAEANGSTPAAATVGEAAAAASGDASAVEDTCEASSRYTSSMCAVLCSMMKAQLLKTYEEVVTRYGGHFDMRNIDDRQKAEAAIENQNNPGSDLNVFVEEANGILSEEASNAIIAQLSDKIVSTVIKAETTVSDKSPPVLPETSPPTLLTCDSDDILRKMSEGVHESTVAMKAAVASIPPKIKLDELGSFVVLDSAPDTHKFKLTMLQPSHPSHFYKTVKNEMRLLQTSLPAGIWVRGYQDRMDLYSVMIRGPAKTPYQDGLFLFDFQLSADYPHAPPLCNYVPYCSDRLNPNLYEDGKVCISLLGTWSGKGTEVWTHKSNLLQVIISIQGLILVSEPYFNEAGYERQKGSQQGHENSRMYNEMVLLKLIQATARMLQQPPLVFKEKVLEHLNANGSSMMRRLKHWLQMSEGHNSAHPLSPTTPNTYRSIVTDAAQKSLLPEFPLIPASKGFCLTLRNTLPQVQSVFDQVLAPGWAECDLNQAPSKTSDDTEEAVSCVTIISIDQQSSGDDSNGYSSISGSNCDNVSHESCDSGICGSVDSTNGSSTSDSKREREPANYPTHSAGAENCQTTVVPTKPSDVSPDKMSLNSTS